MSVQELNTLSSDCLCPRSVRLCLSDTEQSEWIQGVEWGYGILPAFRGSRSWPCFLFDLTLGGLKPSIDSSFYIFVFKRKKGHEVGWGRIMEEL